MVLGNSKPLTDYLVRRPRVSGRKMSGTSSYFPRHLLSCDLPYEMKEKDGKNLSSQTWPGSPRRPSPRHPGPPDFGCMNSNQQIAVSTGRITSIMTFRPKSVKNYLKNFQYHLRSVDKNVGNFAFSNAANTLQARNYLKVKFLEGQSRKLTT